MSYLDTGSLRCYVVSTWKGTFKRLAFVLLECLMSSTDKMRARLRYWVALLALVNVFIVSWVWAGPLHEAAQDNNVAEVRRLIARGAKVNDKNKDGLTALHWAAYNGHSILAELLIDKGAKLNLKDKYGYAPLHWAAIRGSKAVAELLIRKGSNVNARGRHGNTPLSWARLSGHEDIVELLTLSGGTE